MSKQKDDTDESIFDPQDFNMKDYLAVRSLEVLLKTYRKGNTVEFDGFVELSKKVNLYTILIVVGILFAIDTVFFSSNSFFNQICTLFGTFVAILCFRMTNVRRSMFTAYLYEKKLINEEFFNEYSTAHHFELVKKYFSAL